MIDETVAFITILIAGIAGSFLSYWMAFNAKGEPFDMKKHGNALITGAVAGLAFAITSAVVDTTNMTAPQFGFLLVTTFLGAFGLDRARSSGSDMIARNEPPSPQPQPTG